MIYQNGRQAQVGDWVVGPTHHSENHVTVGVILELMEGQGNCGARLLTFPKRDFMARENPETERTGLRIAVGKDQSPGLLGYRTAFADTKNLLRVDDGLRLSHAVVGSGLWNSPYFGLTVG